MVKIVKNPGNGRLNNLNDPVLNVLKGGCITLVGAQTKTQALSNKNLGSK